MTSLPEDAFGKPVEEVARRLLLGYLAEAGAGAVRLSSSADAEALHDFRVALRRARSVVRAYLPELAGSVKGKDARELRDLAHLTSQGRDAEVLLAWVRAQEAGLTKRQTPATEWLAARLVARRDEGYAVVHGEVLARFETLRARLAETLPRYRVEMHLDAAGSGPTPYPVALAALVRRHARELDERLAVVQVPTDVDAAHEARIAAKRLRYLVDPIAVLVPEARTLAKAMKSLQEVLGELHDMHVLSAELAEAMSLSASERARRLHDIAVTGDPDGKRVRHALRHDERPGMLALAQRVRARELELFRDAETRYLGAARERLYAEAEAAARALEHRGTGGIEVERKYLLRGEPAATEGTRWKEIWQGYLPGERLIERLRRVRDADGAERFFRTVKLGAGETRIEVEEETTEALFEKLWPLTRGKRVHKRRYVVPEGTLAWEIDVFLDRPLVLAELELPRPGTPVEIPAWLAPLVERDVTDEPAYVNARLAK